MKAFGDNPHVKALCEPRERDLRVDDVDRTAYTLEDMRLVLVSLVVRVDRTHIDVADWHPLFADNTYRHIGMSTICTRLDGLGCAQATVLDISNCGWAVEDLVQCLAKVAKCGKRLCHPSVSVLPNQWSQCGQCYRRPDGVYVRRAPPMEDGAYQPMPPLTEQMLSSSTEPLRCVICTRELSAHAPSLGQLHTLNLSYNRCLGDIVAPPKKWVRGERLAKISPRQHTGHKWTCPSSGEMYLGPSPPGSAPLGAKALGDALLHHQTLTELDVSGTGLRNSGCAHLVRGLTGNVSLHTRTHTYTRITTDATYVCPLQTVMRTVRAHCNYFTDDVLPMWRELFEFGAMLHCRLRTVGIFDEWHTLKAIYNFFSEDCKRRLDLSVGRTHIALVTKMHWPADDL